MYHSEIELKEGAFIVSDSHYSQKRPELLEFLKDIKSKKLLPTQLILMGDIFDALIGGVEKTIQKNHEAVSLINTISKEIEVVYLEGNHDFNLKTIFPNTKVYSISKQPLKCKYGQKNVLLAHGDQDSPMLYQIYTAIIRNRIVLKFLNIFDEYILSRLESYLDKKDDCKEMSNLEDFITRRLSGKYDCDYFLEGHFHQNRGFKLGETEYINLGAFACNQRYFIVKSSKHKELLEEKIFSKER